VDGSRLLIEPMRMPDAPDELVAERHAIVESLGFEP
jgi:hypothetical protein